MTRHWEVKTIADLATCSLGKMLDKSKNKGVLQKYLRNTNVRWFHFDLTDLLEMPFLDSETEKYTARKGDVLVCEGGYPGRAAIWNEDTPIHFQKAIHRVRFHEPERNTWFLYYLYMLETSGALAEHFTGTGIQHLTSAALSRLTIPVPPLQQQKRIVSMLDEAFTGINAAMANVEKNLANAREIFESYLTSRFMQAGEKWVTQNLASVTTKIGSGATPRGGNDSYKTGGLSLIRSLNVHDRQFVSDKLAFIDDAQAMSLSNVTVESGDVLFNITGASVARCCIVPDSVLPARVNQHVAIIRSARDTVTPQFLCYLLTSEPYKKRLLDVGEGGSTRQAITKAQLQAFHIAFPMSLEEQNAIVAGLDHHRMVVERLESLFQRKLSVLAELKQSILQKAFAGELTAREAERELAAA